MAAEETVTAAPPVTPKKPRRKKKRMRRVVKSIITFIIVMAVLAAAAYAVWYFVFREEEPESEILTSTATIGTIQSTVQGSGRANAGASAAVTTEFKGVIQEVFAAVDDMVFEGQPLYSIYSPDAATLVQNAQKAVDDQLKLIAQQEENVEAARKAYDQAVKRRDDAVAAHDKTIEDRDKALEDYAQTERRVSELTVRSPGAGKLRDVADLAPGKRLEAGEVIATLVHDRQMRLSLYFSYAYENDMYVGQSVSVSIDGITSVLPGIVEAIHKVSFVSPEGGIFFEADILFDNPGTLTEGMTASAYATANGHDITPYSGGELSFSGTTPITATLAGSVETADSLREYMSVEAGDVLLIQGRDGLDELLKEKSAAIESAEEAVAAAQENITANEEAIVSAQEAIAAAQEVVAASQTRLAELREELETAHKAEQVTEVLAPISGTVTSCAVFPGMEVDAGTTVITISDTTVMTVELTVDDRNIPFVTPGMEVTLQDYNGMTFIGTVTKIDLENGQSSGMSGMTSYPVTVTVENSTGSLRPGMWPSYAFVTSEAVDVVTVPIQCVKSIVDTEGNPHTVVFVKAEERPENAIDFEPPEAGSYYGGASYPTPEEGFWPVPVETGLSDRYNLEITSGLEAGAEIFNAYMMTGAYSY